MYHVVYDGHGGAKIAAHISKHLHKFILSQSEYKEGDIRAAIVKVITATSSSSKAAFIGEFNEIPTRVSLGKFKA